MKEKQELQVMNNNEIAITPQTLLMKAIEKGVDVDQLGKFMELQEKFEKKEASKAFKIAMAGFQSEKPVLIKNGKVDFITKTGSKVKYNFISLSSIQGSIDSILSKYGLSYRWEQEDAEKAIKITCIVSHIDGHEERTYLKANADTSGNKNDIQSIASTVTYLKRYTLEGALGLSSSEDNDGMNGKKTPPQKPLISLEVFKRAIIAVNKGTATKETILSSYSLTEDQSNTIDAIVNSKKKSDETV